MAYSVGCMAASGQGSPPLSNTYAAFKAAGVPEAAAQAAAEELADYQNRLASVDQRLMGAEGKLAMIESRLLAVELKVAQLTGKITVLTWAVGINAALTVAVLGVLLRGHS